jgi:adenylate cyclase
MRPGRSRRALLAGLVVSLLAGGVYLHGPAGLADLDQRMYDVLLGFAHHRTTSGRVVVVDVDERSLARFGRWPWPRSTLAGLLEAIHAQGAASIGLDMMFPESDRTPAADGAAVPAGPASGDLAPQDAALAAILGAGRFVLGHGFTFGAVESGAGAGARHCVLHPVAVTRVEAGGAAALPVLYQASGAICSLAGLAAAAADSGFLNAAPDGDGVLRRIPLVIEHEGRSYPSLALATVLKATGAGRQLTLEAGRAGSAWLRLRDDLAVPLDSRGNMLLHFRGRRGTIAHVSAVDVVTGRLPAGALRDRVALVGTTAMGLREAVSTPLDPVFAGVEVQATVADNLLAGDFLSRPGPARAAEVVLVLLAGPLGALLLAGSWWAVAMVPLLAAALWAAAAWALGAAGVFLSPLYPTIALGAGAAAAALAGLAGERRRADGATTSLAAARQLVLHALTSLTEIRDPETGAHLLRTQHYTRVLCRALASHPRFRAVLTPDTIELLASLAPIHDIGKVGVPDSLLRKPGPFTPPEYDEMRKHPGYGRDVIERAQRRVGIGDELLIRLAKDIVYAHHERWDGTGYPMGLAGDAIPVAGRLVALVDVYDALLSERVYKSRIPHAEVVDLIVAGSGTQFDPDVVAAFLSVEPEWRRIAVEFADDSEASTAAGSSGSRR